MSNPPVIDTARHTPPARHEQGADPAQLLAALAGALVSGGIEIVDLTQTLSPPPQEMPLSRGPPFTRTMVQLNWLES